MDCQPILLSLLLAMTGMASSESGRVKRQSMEDLSKIVKNMADDMDTSDINDLMNKAKDVVDDIMAETGNVGDIMNSAKDLAKQAEDMANQMMQNLGLDVSGLPSELQQVAGSLFQITNTSMFGQILENVQNGMAGHVSLQTLQDNFKGQLTDLDFLKAASDIMEKHDNNPDSAGFKADMERLVMDRMKSIGGGAPGLRIYFTFVFAIVTAHLLV